MNTQKILIVTARLDAITSWPAQYETVFAPNDEAAIELAQRQDFAAVVLDGTDPELHTAKLRAILPILLPDAALFNYEGEGEAPVQALVSEHFRRERNARIRRFVVLDEINVDSWTTPPAFSAN
ncbi:MAG: hypothetical protein EOO15_14540 [Chitinophagaceae bacterium]|nr:MAG: hypothetical protein EOO15_14540 [Chitinophagaceae bacterium]